MQIDTLDDGRVQIFGLISGALDTIVLDGEFYEALEKEVFRHRSKVLVNHFRWQDYDEEAVRDFMERAGMRSKVQFRQRLAKEIYKRTYLQDNYELGLCGSPIDAIMDELIHFHNE